MFTLAPTLWPVTVVCLCGSAWEEAFLCLGTLNWWRFFPTWCLHLLVLSPFIVNVRSTPPGFFLFYWGSTLSTLVPMSYFANMFGHLCISSGIAKGWGGGGCLKLPPGPPREGGPKCISKI